MNKENAKIQTVYCTIQQNHKNTENIFFSLINKQYLPDHKFLKIFKKGHVKA